MPYTNPESDRRYRSTHKAEKKAYDQKYRAEHTAERKVYEAAQQRNGYFCYRGMLARCLNPKNNKYVAYGANGIMVCDRWRGEDGWRNFLADMGPRPSIKHSIDRYPNPEGHYEPANCRWATSSEQWHSRQRAQHGRMRMYKNGCRCDACRAAKAKDNQQYRNRQRSAP